MDVFTACEAQNWRNPDMEVPIEEGNEDVDKFFSRESLGNGRPQENQGSKDWK